jgi:SAM-dependent methyltransferase
MRLYTVFRRAYHALVPDGVRRIPLLAASARRVTSRFAAHDLIYCEVFFTDTVEGPAAQAAPVFARLISSELRPRRIVDVGCGTGALLEALGRTGCECLGLEYAEAALEICRARGVTVKRFDLEKANRWRRLKGCDVAISMEVGEHLPESAADRYVGLLTSLAPVIVFTAAHPGQGGADHLNEQPMSYWVAKFGARGYGSDQETTTRWRRQLEAGQVPKFYSDNLMIFRRRPAA